MAKEATLETRELKEDLLIQERELLDDFRADIIVNASGLGARTLADDKQIFPVRGAIHRMSFQPKTTPTNPWQESEKKERIGFLKNNGVLLPAQYDANNQPSKKISIFPHNGFTIMTID